MVSLERASKSPSVDSEKFHEHCTQLIELNAISSMSISSLAHLLETLSMFYLKFNLQSHQLFYSQIRPAITSSSLRKEAAASYLVDILYSVNTLVNSTDDLLIRQLLYDISQKLKRVYTHEISMVMAKKLLSVMGDSNYLSYSVVSAIEEMILTSSLPTGLFTESEVISILNAYSSLGIDLSSLEKLICEDIIPKKFKSFSADAVVMTMFYLARMKYFKEDLWNDVLYPELAAVNVFSLDEKIALQLYSTFIMLEILAPNQFKSLPFFRSPSYAHIKESAKSRWDAFYDSKPYKNVEFLAPSLASRVKGYGSSSSFEKLNPNLSKTHRELIKNLSHYGCEFTVEYHTPKPFTFEIDIFLPPNIAIEVQGPSHYIKNAFRPITATSIKNEILKAMGYIVVNVPYYEWDALEGEHRQGQVRHLLKEIEKVKRTKHEAVA
jgi:hypothetical protein